jgi:mevalonate kinase
MMRPYESVATAPGKTILFGEHSVVYDEPAIAGAVNKRAIVKIRKSRNKYTTLKSDDLGFEAILNTKRGTYVLKRGKPGIIRYILNAMGKFHDHSPIDMDLGLTLPVGSGLGSSAAVTVATIAALHDYHNVPFTRESLAEEAHKVEEDVQGIASPLDTLVSTYGGLVYLSREKRIVRFDNHLNAPFVIGFTNKYGNTGKMVTIQVNSREPYVVTYDMFDIHDIANVERKVPLNWITNDGTYVSDEYLKYARPFIIGSVQPYTAGGLPIHLTMHKKKK